MGKLSAQHIEKVPQLIVDLLNDLDETAAVTDLCMAVLDLTTEKHIGS